MKSNTPDLVKFKKLMRQLKESTRGIAGLLELLWCSCCKNCPRGDVGRFTNEEIAIMVDWGGDPDQLVNSLVDCKWLDVSDEHRLVVHDWQEHCPNWVKGNLAKAGVGFAGESKKAEPKDTPKAESPSSEDAPRDRPRDQPKEELCVAPYDYPTKSSQVKSSQATLSLAGEDDFETAWNLWKKHLRETQKPLTPTTEEIQLMDIARCIPDRSEWPAVVYYSISRQAKNPILNGDHRRDGPKASLSNNAGYKPRQRSQKEEMNKAIAGMKGVD